jgi:hypothetical protein
LIDFQSSPEIITFVCIETRDVIYNPIMNELTIISEALGSLQGLSGKETIFLDDVPRQLKSDLQNFIIGETLTMREGKLVIGNNLYKKWLLKLNTKGFDYEIDWKQ